MIKVTRLSTAKMYYLMKILHNGIETAAIYLACMRVNRSFSNVRSICHHYMVGINLYNLYFKTEIYLYVSTKLK